MITLVQQGDREPDGKGERVNGTVLHHIHHPEKPSYTGPRKDLAKHGEHTVTLAMKMREKETGTKEIFIIL
jgi:hypothetical protein